MAQLARRAHAPRADAPAVDRHGSRRRAPAAARGPARACSCPSRSGRRARAARPGASVSEARSSARTRPKALGDRVSAEHGRSTGRARRRRRGRGRAGRSCSGRSGPGSGRRTRSATGSAVSSGGKPRDRPCPRARAARAAARGRTGATGAAKNAAVGPTSTIRLAYSSASRPPSRSARRRSCVITSSAAAARGDLEQLLGGGVDERGVQPGGRLVGDHELGLADQRHRVDHALLHPARELVDVAAAELVEVQPELAEQLAQPRRGPARSLSPRARAASSSCPPSRRTGFSAEAGRLRDQRDPPPAHARAARAATRAAARRRRAGPTRCTSALRGSSRSSECASTVLPLPLSPTTSSSSPGAMLSARRPTAPARRRAACGTRPRGPRSPAALIAPAPIASGGAAARASARRASRSSSRPAGSPARGRARSTSRRPAASAGRRRGCCPATPRARAGPSPRNEYADSWKIACGTVSTNARPIAGSRCGR